jgi:2,4-dienoyl-CoA reductase-like NADH-dependent reductase (Old Yellow Enzyme family)
MCQYSCEARDGLATDWHLVHLGAFATGGAGLILAEATAVAPEGRISPEDLGLWSDAHGKALERTVRFCRAQGAAFGVQLAHAGRKASTRRPWDTGGAPALPPGVDGGWQTVGPSAQPFAEGWPAPRALEAGELREVVRQFATAAARARDLGCDTVEVHAAHGYLLHQFMSPLSNRRQDAWGGDFEGRVRLTLEVVEAVRREWPRELPLLVRVSATDWVEGGWGVEDTVRLARLLAERGVDLLDCSSGGNVPRAPIPVGPGYQVPFAERVRRETGLPTGAVGLLTSAAQAEAVLAEGRADLAFFAREFLRDPHLAQRAARELGAPTAAPWPKPYERAR